MDEDTKQACGCLAFVVGASVLGFAQRSHQNWGHFWTMVGVEVLAFVAAGAAIYFLSNQDFWSRVVGFFAGIYAISCTIAIVMFLINGNYEASMKFVTLKWKETTATPASPSAVEATPTKAAKNPTPVATPVPIAAVPDQIEPEPGPWGWLLAPDIADEQFLSTLNTIWRKTPAQAKQTAASLQKAAPLAKTSASKQAVDLLTAVALERAGDEIPANAKYQEIVDRKLNDSYTASAAFRLHFVKAPPGKFNLLKMNQWITQNTQYKNRSKPQFIEAEYINIIREPERKGWFLVEDRWDWSTNRQVAIQVMLDRHSDQISFELFQYLRSRSPLPPQSSFLFIILFLTFGIKLLALPIYVRQAKLAIYAPKIQREIEWVNSLYADNPQQLQAHTSEIYDKYRVEMVSGCIMPVLDLIFVIWAFMAIQGYIPQLALDHARFLWLNNLIERNFWVVIAWGAIYLLNAFFTGELQAYGQMNNNASAADANMNGCVRLSFMLAFWIWIMWAANVSSAVIIFWICLLLTSALFTVTLRAIWKTILRFQGTY